MPRSEPAEATTREQAEGILGLWWGAPDELADFSEACKALQYREAVVISPRDCVAFA